MAAAGGKMIFAKVGGVLLPAASFQPWVQTRNMATLKDIRLRLRSVKNIQKITATMKMIAAAKYSRAERELKPAKPYGEGAQQFYTAVEAQPDEEAKTRLYVALTSDKGLCGAINSGICKMIKADMGVSPDPSSVKLVCVGEKSKQIMQKIYGKNMLLSFKDVGRKSPTFADAAAIYQAIMDSGFEFNQGDLYYNHFKSVVSYKLSKKPVHTMQAVLHSEKLGMYDSVDADVLRDYQDFQTTSLIYYSMMENNTAEQSARMNAMDGATKNAGEMIDKLTLTFNRTRQAVITRELIEIISGAAAL